MSIGPDNSEEANFNRSQDRTFGTLIVWPVTILGSAFVGGLAESLVIHDGTAGVIAGGLLSAAILAALARSRSGENDSNNK